MRDLFALLWILPGFVVEIIDSVQRHRVFRSFQSMLIRKKANPQRTESSTNQISNVPNLQRIKSSITTIATAWTLTVSRICPLFYDRFGDLELMETMDTTNVSPGHGVRQRAPKPQSDDVIRGRSQSNGSQRASGHRTDTRSHADITVSIGRPSPSRCRCGTIISILSVLLMIGMVCYGAIHFELLKPDHSPMTAIADLLNTDHVEHRRMAEGDGKTQRGDLEENESKAIFHFDRDQSNKCGLEGKTFTLIQRRDGDNGNDKWRSEGIRCSSAWKLWKGIGKNKICEVETSTSYTGGIYGQIEKVSILEKDGTTIDEEYTKKLEQLQKFLQLDKAPMDSMAKSAETHQEGEMQTSTGREQQQTVHDSAAPQVQPSSSTGLSAAPQEQQSTDNASGRRDDASPRQEHQKGKRNAEMQTDEVTADVSTQNDDRVSRQRQNASTQTNGRASRRKNDAVQQQALLEAKQREQQEAQQQAKALQRAKKKRAEDNRTAIIVMVIGSLLLGACSVFICGMLYVMNSNGTHPNRTHPPPPPSANVHSDHHPNTSAPDTVRTRPPRPPLDHIQPEQHQRTSVTTIIRTRPL